MASNWPLRGMKRTLWEGGLRGNGWLSGAGLHKVGYVSDALLHVADLPFSLLSLAANPLGAVPGTAGWRDWRAHPAIAARLAKEPPYVLGDGVDNWAALATGAPSARAEVLHEAHPQGWDGANADDGNGQALRVGKYKLITEKGPMWHGPPNDLWYDSGSNPAQYEHTVTCGPAPASTAKDYCHPDKLPCLFDVEADPCEYKDLSKALPDVVASLTARLAAFQATAVPKEFHQLNGTNCTSPTPPKGGSWMPYCA
jgi:arylsulfatase A-like enzyme